MSRFGQNLRALRERAGLTQEELARKLGYKRQSPVSHWETGKTELPEAPTIIKMAQELGCSTTDLMRSAVTPWDALRGSTDVPTTSQDDIRLTDDERTLIRLWRRLPDEQKRMLQTIVEATVRFARRRRPKGDASAPGPPSNSQPSAAAKPAKRGRRPKAPDR